jgi:hypothetical protein
MKALVILGDNNRPQIIKGALELKNLALRKIKDSEFFNDHLMKETLSKANDFYKDFTNQMTINLNATE